jgi:hypothetical protein
MKVEMTVKTVNDNCCDEGWNDSKRQKKTIVAMKSEMTKKYSKWQQKTAVTKVEIEGKGYKLWKHKNDKSIKNDNFQPTT